MDIATQDKLSGIFNDMCDLIATRIVEPELLVNKDNDPDFEPDLADSTGLEGEDRIRVRAAWRHYLTRLGVTWGYSQYDMHKLAAPEGHVAIADQMTDKGTTTLFIPNEVAEKALQDDRLPNQEDIPRRASSKKANADGTLSTTGEPIMRAARNTTQYFNLSQIEPTADDRGIVFRFDNGTSFRWSVVDHKFYHGDTGTEFGQSHFGNIVWDSTATIKPGHYSFFSTLAGKAKTGWTNNFFRILSMYIKKRVEDHRRDGAYKLAQKRLNKLDTMVDRDLIWPIESLAKNNFVAQMNLENLCQQVFRGEKVMSFKDMQESGLDKWFFKHVGERVAPRYLRNDQNNWNMNEDVYAGDDNRQYILGNYMDQYRGFVKAGMGDIFQYVWERHHFPLDGNGYNLNRFKECFDYLVGLGCDPKRLMDYIFEDLEHQGLGQHAGRNVEEMTLLRDYARMATAVVGRDFDRYPRYLKTAHDIVSRNFRVNQSKILSKKYEDMCEGLKRLEFKGEKFSIVAPKTLDLIVKEGQALNHCVANYIDGLVEGQYSIVFLRSNEDLDKPLVTVQVHGDRVSQARGVNNRAVTQEEQEFLDKFAGQIAKQKEMFKEEAA
jgi:hypothetical protein